MADYGPLTPSNRLEWFLANGGSGGSGGGGESDFSLASVTITNTEEDGCEFFAPVANVEDGHTQAYNGIDGGTTVTLQVVLYKGKAIVMIAYPMTVSASSGAFEDLGDGDCMISGDCTITVSQSIG